MQLHDTTYNTYIEILKEELVPAMGCTEPIAIAYCGAKVLIFCGIFRYIAVKNYKSTPSIT